jgi:heterodisulfide reductase subunit C
MGKMKALLIDKEPEDNQEFEEVMEEMHYFNTMNNFMSLIKEHGWDKVTSDLRALMGTETW